MKIVIAHYHLQTGGVTRVIESASAALVAAGHRVVVVAGEPPVRPLPDGVAYAEVPLLRYEERRPDGGPETLERQLVEAAIRQLGGLPDVWHIHNHSLGKNTLLPAALVRMAHDGQRMLLQPHDFAEDGRPGLYERLVRESAGGDAARLSALLYPIAEHIHYAPLNARDHGFLATAGVPEACLHVLPNAVDVPPAPETKAHPFADRRLWLYPTRAIRRKNIGEFLFWSLAGDREDVYATTLAPQNPVEQPRYERWVGFARRLDLPTVFELGDRVDDFGGLLASAHAFVTTSVAEGFGLAFLEPWLAGRPLAGRDLPEVTRDFTRHGIDLDDLYSRLDVPLDWLDVAALRKRIESAWHEVVGAYGRAAEPGDQERIWSSMVRDGRIDFGRLDELGQEAVIQHLHGQTDDLAECTPAALAADMDAVPSNRARVVEGFGLAGYGHRLEAIYEALMRGAVQSRLAAGDAARLLDAFLAPERFCLLRT